MFKRKGQIYIVLISIVMTIGMQGCGTQAVTQTQAPTDAMDATPTPVPSPTTASTPAATPSLSPIPEATSTPISTPAQAQIQTTDFDKNANIQDLFKYEIKAFNEVELGVTDNDGVKIHEISYDSYDTAINKGKVTSYLVVPEGNGPFPAVIYMHWLGPDKGNKKEFLEEAVEMAKRGSVGFLIDGYFPWKAKPNGSDKDRASIIYQVIELRRAIDFVASQPCVDSKRLAYVGHDYGAMFGSLLSGIENRIGAYALVAGMGNFQKWFVAYWVRNAGDEYLKSISVLDPANLISNAAPSRLFFQFSSNDAYISKNDADEYYAAAPDTKEEKFYDSVHSMNSAEIKSDRMKWLSDYLGLKR